MTASQVRAAELLLKRTWPAPKASAPDETLRTLRVDFISDPVAELIEAVTQDQFTLRIGGDPKSAMRPQADIGLYLA